MTLDELLAAYGERLAGRPFAIDGKGVCELAFAQGVNIVLEPMPGEGTAQLWSVLGRLPPVPDQPALFRRLLEGNLFGLATGGATLALDAEEILLCRGFEPERLDAAGFAALLDNFADMAALWTRELSAPPAPAVQATAMAASLDRMIRG